MSIASIFAGVLTGVEFPNMKKFRIRCQAKFLTSHLVHMHRVIFYIPNTLIKLII